MAMIVLFVLAAGVITGAESACTDAEVQTLMACINPYNTQFTTALTGSTCNRAQISTTLCSSYTNIVTCANSAAVSSTTCRPSAISQINGQLVIPCKIEDFQAVCTSSPKINTGSGSVCTDAEVQTLMACISPYNTQFTTALTGSTCNRAQISTTLCSSYTSIVTCANSAAVSSTTCRPSAISQINGQLVIPCKIEDFQAVCTSSPKINTGSGSVCTDVEVQTLMACISPYNTQFTTALTGSTCNRAQISTTLCSSYTSIVNCANSAAVSSTTCRPSAISQINGQLVIPCKIEDFQTVCTSSPKINTGSANGGGSIHSGWTITIVVAVVVLSSASLR